MTISSTPRGVSIALAGTGSEADRWAQALRGIEGVSLRRIAIAGDDELLATLAEPETDAIAFVPPLVDLAGALKRTLMARRDVLVAGPVSLATRQLELLADVGRRRDRLVVFESDLVPTDSVDFVRRMTSGPQALWRPRYVRILRTGCETQRSLDDIATADIGAALRVLGGIPSQVSAIAPRIDDETGASGVAMVTMLFDGGTVARIDVSLIEPELRQEMTIACEGRTLVLDALNERAPLIIQAAASHRGPAQNSGWTETISERPAASTGDPCAARATAFVAAVRGRDRAATNVQAMIDASTVWEAARQSMSRGGEWVVTEANQQPSARPLLKLIRGGGHATADHPAPELTLVRRRAAATASTNHSA